MQDAYLLDTSVASIAWDGGNAHHALLRGKLSALDPDTISVCSITIGEVLYGLEVSPGATPERHNMVKQAMSQYHVLNVDSHTAPIYAAIRGQLFKVHAPRDRRGRLTAKRPEQLRDQTTAKELGIQENDLWLVSVAVEYDMRFVTCDKRLERFLEAAKVAQGYDRALLWKLE